MNVVVNWNPTFSGDARLSVQGRNDCGDGNTSIPFLVKCMHCRKNRERAVRQCSARIDKHELYDNTAANAASYKWTLTPSIAGSIAGTIRQRWSYGTIVCRNCDNQSFRQQSLRRWPASDPLTVSLNRCRRKRSHHWCDGIMRRQSEDSVCHRRILNATRICGLFHLPMREQ